MAQTSPVMKRKGRKRKKGKDATRAKVGSNAQSSLRQGFTPVKG